jgi:hypothetical protein
VALDAFGSPTRSGRPLTALLPSSALACRIIQNAGHGVRKSGVGVDDARNLPAAEDVSCDSGLSPIERQIVNEVGVEDLRPVIACRAILRGEIVGVLRRRGVVEGICHRLRVGVVEVQQRIGADCVLRRRGVVEGICHRLRVGVVEVQQRIGADSFLQRHLQAVVIRQEARDLVVDGVITLVGPDKVQLLRGFASRRRSGDPIGSECSDVLARKRLIQIDLAEQVRSVGSVVANVKEPLRGEFTLHVEAPLLRRRTGTNHVVQTGSDASCSGRWHKGLQMMPPGMKTSCVSGHGSPFRQVVDRLTLPMINITM